MIDALYLSPHFDDAVLSCGGQIHQRTRRGQRVAVVTVCAAPPPDEVSPFAASLHARWRLAAGFDRAAEDRLALARLKAEPVHLEVHDCIYRRSPSGGWLYESEAALFGDLSPLEAPLLARLAEMFDQIGPLAAAADVFSPAAVGHHVDHQLVRAAADRWQAQGDPARARFRLRYYVDYPYAASLPDPPGTEIPLTQADRLAKIEALRAYRSQLSTFWGSQAEQAGAALRWSERTFD